MVTRPADRDQPPAPPLLRVIRGDATPEEIAALVAVLMAVRPADDGAPAAPARSAWSDPSVRLHVPPHAGPGAWRRSALPGAGRGVAG
ncbi:MAG: acyl-CoA carboxylase subunit epsilon [Actinomycetota bacterium]|nr:acyl-CoA carboxylase subunit epsilon [Actinomycetota bacterium]